MNPAFIHGGLAIGSETSKHGGPCEETEGMLSKGILGAGDLKHGKSREKPAEAFASVVGTTITKKEDNIMSRRSTM